MKTNRRLLMVKLHYVRVHCTVGGEKGNALSAWHRRVHFILKGHYAVVTTRPIYAAP